MQPYDPINLFVPKENIANIFLCVECLEEDPLCSYTLQSKVLEIPKIEPKEKYNYLLSNQESRIDFNMNSDAIYNLGINITIGTIPSNINYKYSQIKNGKIYQIKEKKNNFFPFTVKGEEKGDFITIGSNEIINNVANELKINDLEIMGILTEDNKEICFPVSKINSSQMKMN